LAQLAAIKKTLIKNRDDERALEIKKRIREGRLPDLRRLVAELEDDEAPQEKMLAYIAEEKRLQMIENFLKNFPAMVAKMRNDSVNSIETLARIF
jgi:hypothetical protein